MLKFPIVAQIFTPPLTRGLDPDQSSYRADIDGLRAIAVTSVVLFHAGVYPIHSGFVGVDIFFVISGYLIGGIILREVSEGRFSFFDFYARRARRILPALLVVVVSIIAFGWFILSPFEYRNVAATSMTALLAFSNVSFWRYQDYFDSDAGLFPLLMTWSLGVEEQFYVAFPFLILGILRWVPEKKIAILFSISIASLTLSAVWAAKYPAAAFYLLPSRAWELGAGAILAALERRWATNCSPWQRTSSFSGHLVGLLGLTALIVAVCCIDKSAQFPGLLALLPVLGTVALIWSKDSFVNRWLLSFGPLVFIGLISYSWYLWHWPLMAYIRIISVDKASTGQLVLAGGLALLLAVVSWRYIEQPLRRRKGDSRSTLVRYGILVIAVVIVAVTVKHGEGLPERLSADAISVHRTILAGRGDCLATFAEGYPDVTTACVTKKEYQGLIALIGDSHAAALGPGLREKARQTGWGIGIFTKSSCQPLLGVRIVRHDMPWFADRCSSFMEDAFNLAASDADVKVVILAGLWNAPNFDIFQHGIERSVAMMKERGKRVIIVGGPPLFRIDPTHVEFAKTIDVRGHLAKVLWRQADHAFPDNGVSTMVNLSEPAILEVLREMAARLDVEFVDLERLFCSGASCMFRQAGDLLFIDHGHLSVHGSRLAARAISTQ